MKSKTKQKADICGKSKYRSKYLKDLKELFGLETTKYLIENCSIANAYKPENWKKTKALHSYCLQNMFIMNCLNLWH